MVVGRREDAEAVSIITCNRGGYTCLEYLLEEREKGT